MYIYPTFTYGLKDNEVEYDLMMVMSVLAAHATVSPKNTVMSSHDCFLVHEATLSNMGKDVIWIELKI